MVCSKVSGSKVLNRPFVHWCNDYTFSRLEYVEFSGADADFAFRVNTEIHPSGGDADGGTVIS